MHDLDRTMTEFEEDVDVTDELEFEGEYEDEDELEFEDDDDSELEGESEYEGEMESEFESEYESEFESSNPFAPEEELELAEELLSVQNDEELEFFLGKLVRRAGRKLRGLRKKAGRFLRSRGGKFLKRALKRVAKRGLTLAGRAAGGFFGGPAGAAVGRFAGRRVGKALGLEFEGMSEEDQELEVAKRVVRMAGQAVKKAASTSSAVPTPIAAKKALVDAAAKHVPGLVRKSGARPVRKVRSSRMGRMGKWMRRGNRIVLLGV